MRHHILVKWKDDVEKPALEPIAAIFQGILNIPGVQSVSLHPNVTPLPNRYDLLILICMKAEALTPYNASAEHAEWKARYGALIAQKAIFDCE